MSTSTVNPFDLLGEDDSDDISQLVAVVSQKAAAAVVTDNKKDDGSLKNQAGKNESQNGGRRGDGRGQGRGDGRGLGRGEGRGQGGRGYDRGYVEYVDSNSSYNGYSGGFNGTEGQDGVKVVHERRGGYGGNQGGRRGDFSNGDASYGSERPPRRTFERNNGYGRGNDSKREGSGRGNWGTPEDDIVTDTNELVNENVGTEKHSEEIVRDDKQDASTIVSYENVELSDEQKEWIAARVAERIAEEKKKTLDEYEKELEEKRKALPSLKSEERKVDDKEFNSMKLLSNKKKDEEVFVKLGKDKRKEVVTSEVVAAEVVVAEKSKKSVSINEFLKPADGVNFRSGGRGGGRGRGGRGRGGGNDSNNVDAAPKVRVSRSPAGSAPSIQDDAQFPTLYARK